MLTAIGFNQGQIGDLALNIIAARALKEAQPDVHLTFSINKKYASAAPIFHHHPLIDAIKIWDGYDDWPTQKDMEYIDNHHFDMFFSPNPKMVNYNWAGMHHHSQEVCAMHRLTPPKDLSVVLTQYFDLLPKYKNCIAFAPFTSAGSARDIPFAYAKKLVEHCHALGYDTVQLGLPTMPDLGTKFGITGGTIFEDVVIARSCKLLVTADTGINYLMSGYKHPTVGLYSTLCYPYPTQLVNRIPVNPNAQYIEGASVETIDMNRVFYLIENQCKIES